MKHLLKLIAVACIPLFGIAQNQSSIEGIQFEQGLDWKAVKEKANQENKFIFVDCYTTWCTPCKLMDKEVYVKPHVGKWMNERFISVKVQMDTSKKDDEAIKRWYAEARNMQVEYAVTKYPTFLYFSPSGEIVHRFEGAIRDTDFTNTAIQSLDTAKQYYTLLKKYQQGIKNYERMIYLARVTKDMGNATLAVAISKDYLFGFLERQPDSILLLKNNLQFASTNWHHLSSKSRIFDRFYQYADKINTIMGVRYFAQKLIGSTIFREQVDPVIWKERKAQEKPDWAALSSTIGTAYNSWYANKIILDAKLRWSTEKNDWPNIIEYSLQQMESYGPDTVGLGKYLINNFLYEVVFKRSTDRTQLSRGIAIMNVILKNTPDDPTLIDTYANLLYKSGQLQAAMDWQRKAIQLEKEIAQAHKTEADPSFTQNLAKMQKNVPTWLE